jgi:hypothetical protein
LILSQACVSRKQINAAIWKVNTPIPSELCARESSLKDYGFYRKLNDGRLEFVSFCKEESRHFLSITEKDFENIMNEVALPDETKTAIKKSKY